MIDVQSLRKQYGDLVAVDGATFTVAPGEIFGLLGPNGAGKSTTIACLCGLLRPTSGRVAILGHDVTLEPVAAKARLGVVPQELALYEDVSATDNLRYWGAAYGVGGRALQTRVARVLDLVGLADRAREPVKRFSGGMKRRLNFGCALVHEPTVLLLDEPTVGIDPQSRVRLLDLVRAQARQGTCVVYTTHYMDEAQHLCDRLAIVDHGRLIAMGTLDELRRLLGERDVVRLAGRFAPDAVRAVVPLIPGAEIVQVEEASLILTVPDASRHLPVLFAELAKAGADIRETVITEPNLESLFIKLTGRELRE